MSQSPTPTGMVLIASSLCGLFVFLYLLSNRLTGPNPADAADDLQANPGNESNPESYRHVEMLEAIPRMPTHDGYAVIGGSGFLGTYLVRLLLRRGETNIRIIDLSPPKHPDIISNPAVSFVQADVRSLSSIGSALTAIFSTTGTYPTVVYHTAAVIRFWERASYCIDASYAINVEGTANIISVLKDMPGTILIYTSSADAALPRPRFFRLGFDGNPKEPVVISDDDPPLPEHLHHSSCYARSKVTAEKLILQADKAGIVPAAILRPGQTILGPDDRLISSTLIMPNVPVFDAGWSATSVAAWDVVAAHLLLEDALKCRPQDVRGQAFLITGKSKAESHAKVRNTIKKLAKTPVTLTPVSPLLILVLAHLVEAFLFLRYHILLAAHLLIGSSAKPRLTPDWMGGLIYLQPATLDYLCEIVIDDSRARKVLGYRPLWNTTQCIRDVIDKYDPYGEKNHGLSVPPQL